jgi:hypothetical protein
MAVIHGQNEQAGADDVDRHELKMPFQYFINK